MSSKHILVVGAGSVGKRHLRNLKDLGCVVSAVEPRPDRLEEAAAQVELHRTYADLGMALEALSNLDGLVVASPPSFHVRQCVDAARAGLPILLEKPVAPDYAVADWLAKTLADLPDIKLLLGYSYRWWPPLQEFRNRILAGEIGKPLYAKFVMGAHLADWHPWERYQDFFMASKELGGGALLDESHFIDLILWFFGMPTQVWAKVERISSLEIETDDNVDMLAIYENNLRVNMHLDLYTRPHEKFISVVGETGTLRWSFEPNMIQLGREAEQRWEEKSFRFERNDMFVNTAREFLEIIDGKTGATCSLQDGLNVLKVVEACRDSSLKGCAVNLLPGL